MSHVYFTSDLHLGHEKVLKFGSRPHDTVEEMFECIKAMWNDKITKRDVVYILGDIAWSEQWALKINALDGRKRLIMGNHDNNFHPSVLSRIFEKVQGCAVYKGCILTHIPIHPDQFYRWRANIHGHIHDKHLTPKDNRYINVNIDVTREYVPILFTKLMEELNEG